MPLKNNVALIVVTFNNPALIKPQIDCIKKYCRDAFDLVIVDNSNDKEAAAAIKYHTEQGNHRYLKVNAASHGGSQSHAWACNMAWLKIAGEYDYLFFLDHDCFPTRPFSVVEMLSGKAIAGLGQQKSKTYYWAGFVLLDRAKVGKVDFGCNAEHGLDTGGNLYQVIERVGVENCGFFGEEYFENPYFVSDNPKYNHYTVIADGFMHFVGGSNWEGVERNEERVNSLLNVLQERVL